MDAEYYARILGAVDPMTVKHVVQNEDAEKRTHPTYLSLNEQWEKQVQALQRLRTGQAVLRLSDDSVHTICTRTLPAVHVPPAELARVRATYLARYFVAAPPLQAPGATGASPPGIGRRSAGWRV